MVNAACIIAACASASKLNNDSYRIGINTRRNQCYASVPVVKRFTFPHCRVLLCDNGNFLICDLPTESFLAKKRYMFTIKSQSETMEEKALKMAKEDFAYWDKIENELISKREQGAGYRQTPDVEFYVDLLDIDIK